MASTELRLQPEEIVSTLYRAILERQPDAVGFSYFLQQIREGVPLDQIIREFLSSEELSSKGQVQLGGDPLSTNAIDLDLSPSQRQYLWEHVAKIWHQLGRDEPYWSVAEVEEFRIANISQAGAVERFYESGRRDIERAEGYLSRNGRRFPERGVCVDYGCGVGRTTLWLAQRCERVLAVDVSQAHLDLARAALAARGVNNVDFFLLRSRQDLEALRGIDLFHSILVLQHNPPPLIADILATAFAGLNKDGAAFFQVPTFGPGYSWRYTSYVAETMPYQQAEMHVLPQSVVFALAAKAGCIPLEIEPDFYSGMPHWISNTFVFAKSDAGGLPFHGGR